jgi:hypothetical protein
MWKRHPVIHFVIGLALTLFLGSTLILSIPVAEDFWIDRNTPPVATEGQVINVYAPQLRSATGGFEIRTAQDETFRYDLAPRLLQEVKRDDRLRVYHSPQAEHVYYFEFVNAPEKKVYQDYFARDALYQQWQMPLVVLLVGLLVSSLGALGYSVLALADWLVPARRVRGTLVARIEQADNSAAGYVLMVRTASQTRKGQHRETCRFQVGQTDFLATDQADYLELEYTPIFKYVRRLHLLTAEDFSSAEMAALQEGGPGRLLYQPGWHFRIFLYADILSALLLFSFATTVFLTRYRLWFEENIETQLYDRYILPALAIGAFLVAVYMLSRFLRKLRDLRAPKTRTRGPVLSKWRVTGVTNDLRRQIVVADGGLEAGSAGVRKFEVNGLLFDELKVGDLVEIEHSPRLRYIFRLEVTGHQKLSKV